MQHTLICGDYQQKLDIHYNCIFADPPDNIGCRYSLYDDRQKNEYYTRWLEDFVLYAIEHTDTFWLSHNSRWSFEVGAILAEVLRNRDFLEAKQCVQTFTFGQHNPHDLGNCHRPLVRLRFKDSPLYPDAIRVPSWRQQHGDKRADPRGRVPGDVFDFPRVTGNSKQRRKWHPTQLHEGLVERCIKLCTKEGDDVFDPFAGTGTTLRVCRRIGRNCTATEIDRSYCEEIAKEHGMEEIEEGKWVCHD